MLQGKHITFSYQDPAKGKTDVLADVSFEIREHDFIGLIGASGSGKTTLIKHLNGLLKAESGRTIRFRRRWITRGRNCPPMSKSPITVT